MNRIFPILIVSLLFLSGFASGDGCMIPFEDFDVYEPGQKAIIAWNGTHEKMILSVDSHSGKETKALHVVPFPSEPNMELGNISSFQKVEDLLNKKLHYGNGSDAIMSGDSQSIEIIHHEKIGPHDLTVTHVNAWENFSQWVSTFLKGKGVEEISFPDGTDQVIKNYLEKNITYFTFDIVELDEKTQTIEPIIYSFPTNKLYFPLEISSLLNGECTISLALVTTAGMVIDRTQMDDLGFEMKRIVLLNQTELIGIEDSFDFIHGDARLSFFEGDFLLEKLRENIELNLRTDVRWVFEREFVRDVGIAGPFYYEINTSEICFYDLLSGEFQFRWPLPKSINQYSQFRMNYIQNENGEYLIITGNLERAGLCLQHIIHVFDVGGNQLWFNKYEYVNSWSLDPLFYKNLIYFILWDRYNETSEFRGINIFNGEMEISINISGKYPFLIKSSLNTVYLQTNTKQMLISLDSGVIIWEKDNNDGTWWRSEVKDVDYDGFNEIFYYRENEIVMMDTKNGEISHLMDYSHEVSRPSLMVINQNMLIIIGEFNNVEKVIAYNIHDKQIEWEYSNANYSSIHGSWVFEDNETIALKSYDKISLFDVSNGQELWKIEATRDEDEYFSNYFQGVCGLKNQSGEEHLLTQIGNKFCTYNLSNAEEIWSFSTDEEIYSYDIIEMENNSYILINGLNRVLFVSYDQYTQSGALIDFTDDSIIPDDPNNNKFNDTVNNNIRDTDKVYIIASLSVSLLILIVVVIVQIRKKSKRMPPR